MNWGQCPEGNENFECMSFEGHSGRCFFFERPAPESLPPASAALTAPPTHSTPEEGRDETTT